MCSKDFGFVWAGEGDGKSEILISFGKNDGTQLHVILLYFFLVWLYIMYSYSVRYLLWSIGIQLVNTGTTALPTIELLTVFRQ